MRPRPAFTLIETLLALGLSSGLILVVFSLVNATAHYHITSQDQIMRSQRLLGLMQDLRFDLHLVQPDPTWFATQSPPNLDETPVEEQLLDRSGSQLRVRSLEALAAPIRLCGSRDALLITIPRKNPRFERPQADVLALGGNQIQSYYQQVLWTHSRSLPVTMPTLAAKTTFISQTFERQASEGLLRIESHTTNSAGGAVSDGVVGPTTCDLVAESRFVSFRYFDGSTWLQSWNSTEKQGLPKAIEVEFEEQPSRHVHRWIVSLAQSNPAQNRTQNRTVLAQEARP